MGCPNLPVDYYNYRYYSAELGRWLSRDPIGELGFQIAQKRSRNPIKDGGFNLYAMVDNDVINNLDYLGLITFCEACNKLSLVANSVGVYVTVSDPVLGLIIVFVSYATCNIACAPPIPNHPGGDCPKERLIYSEIALAACYCKNDMNKKCGSGKFITTYICKKKKAPYRTWYGRWTWKMVLKWQFLKREDTCPDGTCAM